MFYRIYFKILILTFRAIYNMSPSYISNLVSIKSCSAYSLRSNSSLILDRPKGRILSTLGARFFYAAAPTLWNSLPANIWDITSRYFLDIHLVMLKFLSQTFNPQKYLYHSCGLKSRVPLRAPTYTIYQVTRGIAAVNLKIEKERD